jgi:DNA-binding XRE family transcriptional regulator
MEGDLTLDEFIAKQCEDPEFARLWAEGEAMRDLSFNLWRLREERGWTQQQLAARAGIKQPRIAEIERGDANPTLLTLSRLAIALGVRVERFFASTEPVRKEEPGTARPMKLAPPRRVRRRAKA